MKKSRAGGGSYRTLMNPFANPFTDLMIKSSEIALASGQTIWHRSLMMASADASSLTSAERSEFSRMYTEKIQAMLAYGHIVAREMMRLNQQLAMLAWSQFTSGGMAMSSHAAGRDPAAVFAAQRRYADLGARRASEATKHIATAMTRAASQGLTPVHTAVAANAKRLGRRKLKQL